MTWGAGVRRLAYLGLAAFANGMRRDRPPVSVRRHMRHTKQMGVAGVNQSAVTVGAPGPLNDYRSVSRNKPLIVQESRSRRR